jgi:acetyltransferase-like isoleucine patch superfamily enzyme
MKYILSSIHFIENILIKLFYRIDFRKTINFYGMPLIIKHKGSMISYGENITINSSFFRSTLGVKPTIIRTLNSNSKICIGNNVGISGATIIAAKSITICNEVIVGANVQIIDTDFHPINPKNRYFNFSDVQSKPILINENVFIGMNSIILKGTTIGKNSVIGAGSVVCDNVEPNTIVAGNPAKKIKDLSVD